MYQVYFEFRINTRARQLKAVDVDGKRVVVSEIIQSYPLYFYVAIPHQARTIAITTILYE